MLREKTDEPSVAVVAIVRAETVFGVDEEEAAGRDELEEVGQSRELFFPGNVFENLIAKDDLERSVPILERERLS